jgi:hypothetical protein
VHTSRSFVIESEALDRLALAPGQRISSGTCRGCLFNLKSKDDDMTEDGSADSLPPSRMA